MANWSGFVLTDVGAKLQAKINAGLTTLKFTKLGIGSGSGSGSINALTAMVNKVQDINIGSVKANNNIVTINSTLTNKGLGSAYQMRELGLFATDPDEGEILFAYMMDNTPDTMPADGSATVVSQDITLNITFSNTGKVSATIDTGAFVTHEDLNTHNTSSSAHADIRTKITSDINAHNSSGTSHADIRRMFNSYLPLTGGTV
ncbi:MAG: phage tail protein, partial [Veillonella sp.]|nr:phage tail protein [Veillonella sp.]